MSIENLLVILVGLICLAIVFILLAGKGSWLIAGYNMLPKSKKALIDDKKLCKFMGKFMLWVTLWLVIGTLFNIISSINLGVLWGVVLLLSVLAMEVYTWKFKRFLKENNKQT